MYKYAMDSFARYRIGPFHATEVNLVVWSRRTNRVSTTLQLYRLLYSGLSFRFALTVCQVRQIDIVPAALLYISLFFLLLYFGRNVRALLARRKTLFMCLLCRSLCTWRVSFRFWIWLFWLKRNSVKEGLTWTKKLLPPRWFLENPWKHFPSFLIFPISRRETKWFLFFHFFFFFRYIFICGKVCKEPRWPPPCEKGVTNGRYANGRSFFHSRTGGNFFFVFLLYTSVKNKEDEDSPSSCRHRDIVVDS